MKHTFPRWEDVTGITKLFGLRKGWFVVGINDQWIDNKFHMTDKMWKAARFPNLSCIMKILPTVRTEIKSGDRPYIVSQDTGWPEYAMLAHVGKMVF